MLPLFVYYDGNNGCLFGNNGLPSFGVNIGLSSKWIKDSLSSLTIYDKYAFFISDVYEYFIQELSEYFSSWVNC